MNALKNVGFAVLMASVGGVVSPLLSAADEQLERGKAQYRAHGCYTCHGYAGVGKRKLTVGASGIVTNEQAFLAYLRARADVKPALPKQWMPHYPESSLTDKDALAILAYIRTFDDTPPTIEDSKVLSAILEDVSTNSN